MWITAKKDVTSYEITSFHLYILMIQKAHLYLLHFDSYESHLLHLAKELTYMVLDILYFPFYSPFPTLLEDSLHSLHPPAVHLDSPKYFPPLELQSDF